MKKHVHPIKHRFNSRHIYHYAQWKEYFAKYIKQAISHDSKSAHKNLEKNILICAITHDIMGVPASQTSGRPWRRPHDRNRVHDQNTNRQAPAEMLVIGIVLPGH